MRMPTSQLRGLQKGPQKNYVTTNNNKLRNIKYKKIGINNFRYVQKFEENLK